MFKAIQDITLELSNRIITCIIASIIGISLVLPFFTVFDSPSPFVKCFWGSVISALLFLPLMIFELIKYRGNKAELTNLNNVSNLVLCISFGGMTTLCQLIALEFTYCCHVLLFSGMVSIILIFWKLIKR